MNYYEVQVWTEFPYRYEGKPITLHLTYKVENLEESWTVTPFLDGVPMRVEFQSTAGPREAVGAATNFLWSWKSVRDYTRSLEETLFHSPEPVTVMATEMGDFV